MSPETVARPAITPERWRLLKKVLADALELPSERREELLERSPLSPDERRRIEAMLAAHDRRPELLEPAVGFSAARSLEAGDRVDGFRILHKLGEGGMAEVYAAEQDEPFRRRLALKVLKVTTGTSPGSPELARFEAEGQILATLGHPTIAQIYAAGNLRGRPYLAMELVEGEDITSFCDRLRLPIEKRLGLLIEICHGVQHAHQRGVIHRDLKPSNLLILEQDGKPSPKIIDFGISKSIRAPGRRLTERGQWIGTPDYMSPEQATGRGVETRSDVYSLGVLLYQQLTGRLPFDTQALREQGLDVLLDTLRDVRPLPPSQRCEEGDADGRAAARRLAPASLARRLRGDLDLITHKALAKDPDERYASPEELARDLRFHLEHRPLLAAEPTTAEVLRKLVRRHRLAFAAALGVVLTLLAGVVGTTTGLLRARDAERRAQLRAEEARIEAERANREAAIANRVTRFLWELFRASDPAALDNTPGVTLRQVLDRGARRIQEDLDEEPRVRARLLSAIGRTYINLGKLTEGRPLLAEAVQLLEEEAPDSLELARGLSFLAGLHSALAEPRRSLELFERSLEIHRRTLGEDHLETAVVLRDLGVLLAEMGHTEAAKQKIEAALEVQQRSLGTEHLEVARTLNSLGVRMRELDRPAEGLPIFERALGIQERLLGPEHPELAPTLNNLAQTHQDLGQHEPAERLQLRSLAIDEKAFGSDHPYVAVSLVNLADLAWASRRDCGRALAQARRAEEIFAAHYPAHHPHLVTTRDSLASFEASCPASP